HATARPRQASTSFESQATTGRQAVREPAAGTSQRYDLTHCHPGQARSVCIDPQSGGYLRCMLDSEDPVDADGSVDGEHGGGSQARPENAPSAKSLTAKHARNRDDDHGVGHEHGNQRGDAVDDPSATRDPASDVTHDASTAPLVDLLAHA